MSDFEIVQDYAPGALGRIVSLHGSYYHEHWGFDMFFETKVATDLAAFLQSYDSDRDSLWLAVADDRIEGSIAIDGSRATDEGAHLRWFIVSDVLRGKGAGNQLFGKALEFCQERGYRRVYLDTFAGLNAARRIYEREGFELVKEHHGSHWGTEVLEQRFERTDLTP